MTEVYQVDFTKEKLAAWQDERNTNHTKANWRFTTADARIKLKHLYLQFERLGPLGWRPASP
jgi:hypothetical protein